MFEGLQGGVQLGPRETPVSWTDVLKHVSSDAVLIAVAFQVWLKLTPVYGLCAECLIIFFFIVLMF